MPGGTGQMDGHIHTQDEEGGADQVSPPTRSGICPYKVIPYISCASHCLCSHFIPPSFMGEVYLSTDPQLLCSFSLSPPSLIWHCCLHRPSHPSSVFPSHFQFLSQLHSPPLTVKVDRPHLFLPSTLWTPALFPNHSTPVSPTYPGNFN